MIGLRQASSLKEKEVLVIGMVQNQVDDFPDTGCISFIK